MTELETQILETWRIHHRVTLFFIEQIPEEALKATLSKRGGRDVARQLVHVCNVRTTRLKAFRKTLGVTWPEFDSEVSPSKAELLEAFRLSGETMAKYLGHCLENGGAVSNFKRGVVPMIGYYISHEAHHRGGALLTLKQCGFSLPQELRFGIWEWNKI